MKLMEISETDKIPRPEYPRPQFVRENNWLNLNGEWNFVFDDLNIGLREKWYKRENVQKFDKKILVPFCFQSKLSGIELKNASFHDVIWYRKKVKIPAEFQGKRIFLHFGAVDYSCIVYINGEYVGSHEGGFTSFSLEMSDFLEEENIIVLRVEDPSEDIEIPRGKQYWREKIESIFYKRVSGIWQPVWLEFLSPDFFLKNIKIIPDIDKSVVISEFEIDGIGTVNLQLNVEILFDDNQILNEDLSLDFIGKIGYKRERRILKEKVEIFYKSHYQDNPNRFKLKFNIPKQKLYLWDVDTPNLYDLHIKIYDKQTNEVYDNVKSYFGMRKISISDSITENTNRQILLNNKPIYQKLFLVQGYWEDGLYTAPSDDDIKKDIQYVKDFGFNGLRTHQKTFDPRFLYWCDRMGVLVWGEIGNAYRFSEKSQLNLINEFVSVIQRDFNHPSIIAWVPLNEGWGIAGAEKDIKRRFYMISLYYLIKSIDPSRLIIDNDGWWHTEHTDICTRHFYFPLHLLPKSFEDEKKDHDQTAPRIYLKPSKYNNEPIIYSEIGGFGFDLYKKIEDRWGYGNLIENSEELLEHVLKLMKEFDKRKTWIHGFCYTELYDQFQEINGLLTFNREPKFPPSKLKAQLDEMFY